MMNSRLADAITRIRNGYNAKLLKIKVLNSKLIRGVLQVLQNEGFINSFFMCNEVNGVTRELEVSLRYHKEKPSVNTIRIISKPGCRIYIKKDEMNYMINGFGVRILSTNRGIITDEDAKKNGIGGEYLLEVN